MANWRIETKTNKNNEESYFLSIDGIGKYPITDICKDNDGKILIKFPCTYLQNEMKEKFKDHAEGMRQVIEKLSKFGRVEYADDDEWDLLAGDRMLIDGTKYEMIVGEMAIICDMEKNISYFGRGHRK